MRFDSFIRTGEVANDGSQEMERLPSLNPDSCHRGHGRGWCRACVLESELMDISHHSLTHRRGQIFHLLSLRFCIRSNTSLHRATVVLAEIKRDITFVFNPQQISVCNSRGKICVGGIFCLLLSFQLLNHV